MDVRKTRKSPLIFIYLDEVGIESLYVQTVNRLETEFVQGREREKGGRLGAKIGIGRLLGALLGLSEVGAETEFSIGGKHIEEAKMRLTSEHKLFALLKYLIQQMDKEYFEDLFKAARYCSRTEERVFVCVKQRFNMPQFYLHLDGVMEVNRDKVIDFEIGPPRPENYNSSDSYFKRQYRFFMSAGLDKCTRCKGEFMRPSGHDARFFRSFQGKNVPLNVFGYLLNLVDYEYQIKPYAIWV